MQKTSQGNRAGYFFLALLLSTITTQALAAMPSIEFAPAAKYGVGSRYDRVVAGDFNHDNKPDLIAVTADAARLSVFLNNGTGGFLLFTNYTANGTPQSITTGHFNADSHLDIATVHYPSDSVCIWLGSGNGQFSPRYSSMTINSSFVGMAPGDFNSDGKLDLAITTYDVRILLGRGDGFFDSKTNYYIGTTYAIIAANINNDPILDLVTANYSSSSMSVLLGEGNGLFSSRTNYSGDFSEYHYAAVAADFNRDSKVDLATINAYANSVSVRLNNGDGTFSAETKFKTGSYPCGLEVADLNGDGNLDLAAATTYSSSLSILPGYGNGTFGTALTNFPGSSSIFVNQPIVLADFNGDGRPDVASTRMDTNALTVLINQTRPALELQRQGNELRMSWPNWAGYVLQTATNVNTPIWATATNLPVAVGDRNCATNSVAEVRRFYRLKKP